MVLTVFGYLANEKWLYHQVIDRKLADEPIRAEFDDDEEYTDAVEDQRISAMKGVVEIVRRETGIRELRLQAAWVARNQTMLCWQLPDRMRVMRRTPEDDGSLRKLYGFINIGRTFEEPTYLASCDGSLPPSLQKDQVPPALQAMRL